MAKCNGHSGVGGSSVKRCVVLTIAVHNSRFTDPEVAVRNSRRNDNGRLWPYVRACRNYKIIKNYQGAIVVKQLLLGNLHTVFKKENYKWPN